MKNVKKIIASSLMALTMVGAVAAPTIRDFTTKPVTASAVSVIQNYRIRQGASTNSLAYAQTIGNDDVRVIMCLGDWYYCSNLRDTNYKPWTAWVHGAALKF